MKIVRKLLDEKEGLNPNSRYNSDCDCVQTTPDGGETWVDDITADPRHGDGFRFPVRTGSDIKCNAAANMIAFLHNYIDDALVSGNRVSLANAIIAFLVLVVFDIGIIAAIVYVVADAIIAIGVEVIRDAFTEEVYAQLLCIIYETISADGQVSAVQLDAINARIATDIGDEVVTLFMELVFSLIGEVGLSNAGAIGDAEGDCSACGWCKTQDFTAGNGGFAAYGSGQGTYSSGNGWQAQNINLGGTDRTLVQITLTFASTHITSVGFVYNFTGGQQSNPGAIEAVAIFINGTQRAVNYQVATDGDDKTMTVAFDQVGCTSVILEVQCSYGSFGGAATITSVTFDGVDDIPSPIDGYEDC